MELRQLEAFAAVMTVGSVTGAGQMLGRSQPAITRQIKELEDSLGLPLFERNGPKVTPTDRAFSLLAEVEHALTCLDEVRRQAGLLQNEADLQVRVVATLALASGIVPPALAALPDHLRPTHINVRTGAPEQALQWVLSGTVDLGVISLPLEHRGVDIAWIGEAPCVAVLRTDSPLAAKPHLSVADLAAQPIISLANPYRLRRRVDQALQAMAARPQIFESNSSVTAIQMARSGLGIAVVDPATAYGFPMADMTIRPLKPAIPFFFGLITPLGRPQSQTTKALCQGLAEAARTLLPEFKLHDASDHAALLHRINASHD